MAKFEHRIRLDEEDFTELILKGKIEFLPTYNRIRVVTQPGITITYEEMKEVGGIATICSGGMATVQTDKYYAKIILADIGFDRIQHILLQHPDYRGANVGQKLGIV